MSNLKILLLALCIVSPAFTCATELDYAKIDKAALGTLLFTEIERLDANAIAVRNNTKVVKWPEYRAEMLKNIAAADNKEALARAINSAQQGFTNSHAAIQPYPVLFAVPALYENAPDQRGLKIGFTYPTVSFFSLETQQSISHINGIDLHNRYKHFEEFECQFAHANACLEKFVKQISYGWANLAIKDKVSLTSPEGNTWTQLVVPTKPQVTHSGVAAENYCSSYAKDYPSWRLSYAGGNLCLLQNGEHSLLRISRFGDWGSAQNDFYCEKPAKAGSLCADVQALSNLLAKNKQNRIAVDLQDNDGGSENTPLLSLLVPKSFRNNLVKFRFTKEMLQEEYRENLFYGHPHALTWWKQLVQNKQLPTQSGWLPIRTDFCRGDSKCSDVTLPRRAPNLAIDQLIVVVNAGCFSSCDDLTWRLKRDANATIIGQLPVTDGTYVSATGVIYLTPEGELKSKVLAPGQPSDIAEEMTKLLWFRVPSTATFNDQHVMLEGNPSVIDKVIPITKQNFATIKTHNINQALQMLH